MYPGLTDTDCRVAEMRLREMQAGAQARWHLGHDATGQHTGGKIAACRRIGRAAGGVVALLSGRRVATEVRQGAPALQEGAAS